MKQLKEITENEKNQLKKEIKKKNQLKKEIKELKEEIKKINVIINNNKKYIEDLDKKQYRKMEDKKNKLFKEDPCNIKYNNYKLYFYLIKKNYDNCTFLKDKFFIICFYNN